MILLNLNENVFKYGFKKIKKFYVCFIIRKKNINTLQ